MFKLIKKYEKENLEKLSRDELIEIILSQQEEGSEDLLVSKDFPKLFIDRLPLIIDILPFSFIYLDKSLEYTYFNNKAKELFNCELDKIFGSKPNQALSSNHFQQIKPFLARALGGEMLDFKAELTLLEFTVQHLNYTVIPDLQSGTQPDGLFVFIQEVSYYENTILQLRQSVERMDLAIQVANIGIWCFDYTQNHLEVNDIMYKMYEVEADGMHESADVWQDMIHPDDKPKLEELYKKLLEGTTNDSRIDSLHRIITLKGEIKYVRTIFQLFKDEQNNPIKLLGINLDITSSVKSENKLIEREKLYRTLAENFPNGIIFILDQELKYKFAAGSELPNIINELHQIKSRNVYDIAPPEIVSKAQENFAHVFQGNTRNFEIKLGKNLSYLISAIPLYAKDGSIPEIMVVSQNITELKKAEERIRKLFIKKYHLTRELKAREEELKKTLDMVLNLNKALSQSQAYQTAILNNTSHAFYLLNTKLEILTYNRAARRNIKEAQGMSIRRGEIFLQYLKDSEIELFKEHFQKALSGKITENVREIITSHHTKMWVSYRFAPAYDHQGHIFGVTYSTLDITRLKETERELIIAKERAEEMIRLKTNFLANMSHEIRTPLNGILGLAQVIAKEKDLKKIQEYVALQKESGVRLLNTLTGILNLSRLEAEHSDSPLKPIPINHIIRENIKTLDTLAKNKGIFLVAHTFQHELYCLGDENLLFQILNNIIGNGIKFTHTGHILIETGLSPDRTEFMFIRVTDTGIGIDESFLSKIFDPFTQESSGQNRNFEGSGLGLSITKKYVELLGGKVSVSSKKNQGSVFEIVLPLYNP
ncbi:MAG: ATP-binding protein [Microscillaceae bacterium]|nr:ATP-binding protein [Microscillaceae bacterium]